MRILPRSIRSRYSALLSLGRLFVLQGLLTLSISAFFHLIGGLDSSLSSFLGGGCTLLGTLAYTALGVFALRDFNPRNFLWGYVLAHLVKISLVAGLLWLTFKFYRELQVLPFLLTFIAALLMHGLVFLRSTRHPLAVYPV